MGGCASRPKELDDIASGSLPSEAPATPKKAEVTENVAPAETSTEGGEAKKEEPTVDVSQTKAAGAEVVSKEAAETEVVSKEAEAVVTTEPTAEVAQVKAEDKAEAVKEVTEPAKEGKEVVAKVAVAEEAKAQTTEAAPAATSEDKSDAPLVTV